MLVVFGGIDVVGLVEEVEVEVECIGFLVMFKVFVGGGGKGMCFVE